MATRKTSKKKSKGQTTLRLKSRTKTPKNANKTYTQRKVKGTDKEIDRQLPAKSVGWRFVDDYINDKGQFIPAHWYFEDRENRSDTDKERKYHGGVGRRAKPNSGKGKTASRTSRSLTTTRRTAPVRKRDKQKSRANISIIAPPTPTKSKRGIKFYEPKSQKKLSVKELEKVVHAEMLNMHRKPIEHLVVIDKCGNILCRAVGGVSSVQAPPLSFYQKYGRDLIVIHNHPGKAWHGAPTPFSGQDLSLQHEYLIKDERVCCRGYEYRCVIKDERLFSLKPNRFKSMSDRIFRKAADIALETIPIPDQKKGETKEEYDARLTAYQKAISYKIVEIAHKEYGKWLNNGYGVKYTRRLFTKE